MKEAEEKLSNVTTANGDYEKEKRKSQCRFLIKQGTK